MPEIELLQLTSEELLGLARTEPADNFAGALEGALPPPHVADRALKQLEAGVPAFWCAPFLIVARPEGTILGGCTFKGMPSNGDVEIAYGVAKPMRGRGIASAAVAQLLKLAAADRSVQQVVAEILPSNIGSSKVVSRLGFTARATLVDSDGETVVRWIYSVSPNGVQIGKA
ncbi:GNAT family N-acetyltransferase [Pseudoduganella sp. HUAS MS19]